VYFIVKTITQGKYELPDVVVLAALGIVAVMSWFLYRKNYMLCYSSNIGDARQ